MTAQDDVNIIENELWGTAKVTDGIRIHTSWSTRTATNSGKWIAAICGKIIKVVCVKSRRHTQHNAEKLENAGMTYPVIQNRPWKCLL